MARDVDYGIGPVGRLAPGPDPAQLRGRIVGLGPAVKFISDVLTPLGVARVTANRQRPREHNDVEGFSIEGQSGGRQVRTDPPPGRVWPMPPASGPDPDDVRAAGAKKAGQENRAAYRRWMGTPGRPPREPWGAEAEEPFDAGYQPKHAQKPKPPKPMDTTDMRRGTP